MVRKLAKDFGVSTSQVRIIAGLRSREKIIEVGNDPPASTPL